MDWKDWLDWSGVPLWVFVLAVVALGVLWRLEGRLLDWTSKREERDE